MATNNRERIFRLLRTESELTRQDIAVRLSLSMPTALQNITEMAAAGILEECGATESTGGRKAKKIRLCRDAGRAVGINIALHQVELVAADLLGQVLCSCIVPLVFFDGQDWYTRLSAALDVFLQQNHIDSRQVVGAGVSFPGILDTQANQIVRSHIFGLANVSLDRFRRAVPYPAVFANDANCASCAELRTAPDSYLYVSLNESVGGAVMIDKKLLLGNTFQAGEIGHMLLVPGGRPCYCGKLGCVDSYLSAKVLAGEGEPLDVFFREVRAGQTAALARWDTYLEYLAILLTNLRMLINMDLIVGGQAGAYIGPDLGKLCAKAAQYDRFARDVDYILPCTQKELACAVGAAVLALEQFGSRILDNMEQKGATHETGCNF